MSDTGEQHDRMIRVEDKIDRIVDKIGSIDVTLAAQHESLVHHIRRTDILESKIDPIVKRLDMAEGALKLLGAFLIVIGVIESIFHILGKIK